MSGIFIWHPEVAVLSGRAFKKSIAYSNYDKRKNDFSVAESNFRVFQESGCSGG